MSCCNNWVVVVVDTVTVQLLTFTICVSLKVNLYAKYESPSSCHIVMQYNEIGSRATLRSDSNDDYSNYSKIITNILCDYHFNYRFKNIPLL